MSNQVGLLPPQSREEALADLARHPEVGGWKNLAMFLNPKHADDPEGAGKWLHRALDPSRRDAFTYDHHRRACLLGTRVGCELYWEWHCEDTGHKPSDPAEQKSRKLKLLEERERNARRDRQIQQELDELERDEKVMPITGDRRRTQETP